MRSKRGTGLLIAMALGLALTSCNSGPSRDPVPPSTPSPSASGPQSSSASPSTPSTDPKADMRATLADALRPKDSRSAELVESPQTSLTVIKAPWLRGWQVIDVLSRASAHGQRFYVGLSSDGEAVRLTSSPDVFNTMVADAGVKVDTSATAADVAAVFLDATRSFQQFSYRVESLDDVKWIPKADSSEQAKRREVEVTYADKVSAPRPKRADEGWTMHVWTVSGQSLIDHDLTVGVDGKVTDRPKTVVSDLPTPVST